MAFMMKKKKYKFSVELCLEEITAVPFVNAVLFAKVRLLDGNFVETSTREEVKEHKVRWGANFSFVCKMSANASTGVLEPCILRISVRKEAKGGRSYLKLGFTDLNLAEFAGCGHTQRKCLLEGYDTRHRQDNSMLSVTIKITMLSGDILFKVPSPREKGKAIVVDGSSGEDSAERLDEFANPTLLPSGYSTLSNKRNQHFNSDGGLDSGGGVVEEGEGGGVVDEGLELGHSRNSSSTSQVSKGSASQHSRHSSSGDSGHIRNSCLSETGSLDRGKAALERRKKAAEDGSGTRSERVEGTRVNPDSLIDQLIRATNLDDESAETSGLQLFIAKDGTTALGSHEVKSQISTGVFKQVVIEENS